MSNQTLLTKEDILAIPIDRMPMMVFSDALQNIIAAGIKEHSNGMYSHFMWLIAKDTCASMQTNGFRRVKLSSFFDDNRLKLWWNPNWTALDRINITKSIEADLRRPWYLNLYDFLAYPGQLLNIHWLQVPCYDICSDKMKHIKVAEPRYNLANPDPEQVNQWLKEHQPYEVYGRYSPD